MFERITEKTFDEIFPLLESAFPVTELRVKEDQRALLKEPCYRLYGVRREGVFAATFATWEIEDFLYIEHFAVKEEYRNGGYGGMLLDALLAFACSSARRAASASFSACSCASRACSST